MHGTHTHHSVPIVRNWQESGLFQDTKFILPSAPAINVTSVSTVPPNPKPHHNQHVADKEI